MNNATTPYTEVYGAMYCTNHRDFALEGTDEGHRQCESFDSGISGCDLRDLFIESGTR
jgi:hypothetical protein